MKTTYHLAGRYKKWSTLLARHFPLDPPPCGPIRISIELERPAYTETPRLDTIMLMVLKALSRYGIRPDLVVELESRVKAGEQIKATITISQVAPSGGVS